MGFIETNVLEDFRTASSAVGSTTGTDNVITVSKRLTVPLTPAVGPMYTITHSSSTNFSQALLEVYTAGYNLSSSSSRIQVFSIIKNGGTISGNSLYLYTNGSPVSMVLDNATTTQIQLRGSSTVSNSWTGTVLCKLYNCTAQSPTATWSIA